MASKFSDAALDSRLKIKYNRDGIDEKDVRADLEKYLEKESEKA